MTDIPDEAVEAAFDRVGMRIKVLPAGSAYTARDLLYSALEAALPYLGNYTADLCEEIEHKDARIRKLEEALIHKNIDAAHDQPPPSPKGSE